MTGVQTCALPICFMQKSLSFERTNAARDGIPCYGDESQVLLVRDLFALHLCDVWVWYDGLLVRRSARRTRSPSYNLAPIPLVHESRRFAHHANRFRCRQLPVLPSLNHLPPALRLTAGLRPKGPRFDSPGRQPWGCRHDPATAPTGRDSVPARQGFDGLSRDGIGTPANRAADSVLRVRLDRCRPC